MCSIAGYTGTHKPGIISKFLKDLHHRGPDDKGTYTDGKVHLCVNRLAIIDISHGMQPMSHESGKTSIIFNGEIYNYIELRKELESNGHIFQTDCDTEVVLNAYIEWGENLVENLNGMFAFCIYDKNTEDILLFRDRLGEKPIYYLIDDSKEIYFSSEYKATTNCIDNHNLNYNTINNDALAWYFAHKAMPNNQSIDNRINMLPPGSILKYSLKSKSFKIYNYYKIKINANKRPVSENEIIHNIEQLLIDSVRLRMRSDVNVGTFLSGGIDSSLITMLAQKSSTKRLSTYSLIYNDNVYNKESDKSFSRLIAKELGTDHNEVILTYDDYMEELPNIVAHHAQPNCAVLSNWFISKSMSKKIKVALSGDGADELFGSYFLHRVLAEKERINSKIKGSILEKLNSKEKEFIQATDGSSLQEIIDAFTIFTPIDRSRLFKNSTFNESIIARTNSLLSENSDTELLNRMLQFDCKNLLVTQILNYTDLLSMAHSLEVRVPFLDFRLVDYSFSIQSRLKLKNGISKYILKQVCKKYLPIELVNRKKEGFIEPNIFWLKNHYKIECQSVLLGEKFDRFGIFNLPYIYDLVDQFYTDGDYFVGKKIWCLFLFGLWEHTLDC
tara:strand:+ start:2862 stop:4703 length:1842 start_codon:yes stop_codon:yes gene_type:complete